MSEAPDRDCIWRVRDADDQLVYEREATFAFIGNETFTIDFEEDFEIKSGDQLEIEIIG